MGWSLVSFAVTYLHKVLQYLYTKKEMANTSDYVILYKL